MDFSFFGPPFPFTKVILIISNDVQQILCLIAIKSVKNWKF